MADRKETGVTTVMVFVMVVLASLFFFDRRSDHLAWRA